MKKIRFLTLLVPLLFTALLANGQFMDTTIYDFVGGAIVTAGQSVDGSLKLSGTYSDHGDQYGMDMKVNGVIKIAVTGTCVVRFLGSAYSGLNMTGVSQSGGTDLGAQSTTVTNDLAETFDFVYEGGADTLVFTTTAGTGNDLYLPKITVLTFQPPNGKTDVWDFGAEQLDTAIYNNRLNDSIINSWYNGSITVGSSGNVLPSFTAGLLSWTGGSNDRLRTTNTNLTRYDENISGVTGYTGRVYVNSSANTTRYMSLILKEDDEVTIAALSQNGSGRLNFVYVANPGAQTDQEALGPDVTEYHFVAKKAGTYHIYDDQDKPSYYRIYRKDATYTTISGTVDTSQAAGLPGGYGINLENAAGKVWNSVVSADTFSITVPAGYTYTLSLSGANGYIISNGNSLDVTDSTTAYAVSILKVELYNVSGAITGLDSLDLTKLALQFTPDTAAHKVYKPEPVVNADSTYSVQLESGVDYTVSAQGVNDYYIPDNIINIGPADSAIDIAFAAKPVYNIKFNVTGLTTAQQSHLHLSFTNLNEAGYVYNFSSVNNVSLRDGTYSIDYSGLDDYPVKLRLTSNLQVNGDTTSKDLVFNPVTAWTFDDKAITGSSYEGLLFTGTVSSEVAKGHLTAKNGATIQVPVNVGDKIRVTYYYSADFTIGGTQYTTSSGSTSLLEYAEYTYPGDTAGYVTITVGSGASTTYMPEIEIGGSIPYAPVIHVGTDKEYQTINDALDAIGKMVRTSGQRVTVMIDPGNYEEMLVINSPDVTFKNAAANPSIGLTNKGVDIDPNAVRITSYYGHGYNYYSMAPDQKWNADVLRVNKENGYLSYENKGAGTTNGSYWNATVVVSANGFEADHIIFENSFNQYISKKESEDIVVPWASGSPGVRPTDAGNTSVQDRSLVERAAAIAITNNIDKVVLIKCRVVGRQDAFYGGTGARVVVNRCDLMGAVDYIFGGMTAVFYKTALVMNTSDVSSDATYIAAAQQTSGRGFLMYKCEVKSPVPGIETASANYSKPGYFGRPWQANTSEVVYYNTTIDTSGFPGYNGKSMIDSVGWSSSLGGESSLMYEYGTIEKSGVDNSAYRASWSTVLSTPQLTDGTDITTFNFTKGTDNWDPLPVETDTLTISTDALDVPSTGGTDGFDITSNILWSVSSDESWLTVGGLGWGVDTSSIVLTAAQNPATSPRTATITVYGDGVGVKTITVTQAAKLSGIDEISGNTLNIYPNPADGFIVVKRDRSDPENLVIWNNLGQVVFSKMLESKNETITLPQIQPGIYIVDVEGRKMKLVVK